MICIFVFREWRRLSHLSVFAETFEGGIKSIIERIRAILFFIIPSGRYQIYFLRNEHPSVSLALPPVGWHRTVEQPAQMTTV